MYFTWKYILILIFFSRTFCVKHYLVETQDKSDTNNEGKLDKSELNSNTEGEDYGILDFLLNPLKTTIDNVLGRGTK